MAMESCPMAVKQVLLTLVIDCAQACQFFQFWKAKWTSDFM